MEAMWWQRHSSLWWGESGEAGVYIVITAYYGTESYYRSTYSTVNRLAVLWSDYTVGSDKYFTGYKEVCVILSWYTSAGVAEIVWSVCGKGYANICGTDETYATYISAQCYTTHTFSGNSDTACCVIYSSESSS